MRLTLQCGIVKPTKKKLQLLESEYNNIQKLLQGDTDILLYSANKQQALRYYNKIKQREYPLSLRNDLINIKKSKQFWFLKIPIYGVRGGIRLPIKPHREPPKNSKLCESKITRRNGKYIAMLTFEFETPKLRRCSSVLAVDLGERHIATTVLLKDWRIQQIKFYGKDVRGIRRHYNWLRKRLQEKGHTNVVKRIGNTEKRRVTDVLHKISTDIVNLADSSNSCIILGDLTGIRNNKRGRRLNRIISNMPWYKFTQMICYKAEMKGIPVVLIDERYTSKTCHICNSFGMRRTQGYFICPVCGEYNADIRAINIGKRLLSYMLLSGASCEHAHNEIVFHNFEAPSLNL